MKVNNSNQAIPFLIGGGEMGDLIRQKDWSNNPVGNPENWSQSLRTTLSIILNSKFPMFLFWGPELICFYNDAYRPSLGNDGKHPAILGSKAEDFWQEIWSDIKPLIDNILAGGEANWNEDQLLPIYRNGDIEDVYWTFSYSPVNDESGKPGGVFVTCVETTKQVKAIKELEESQKKLKFAISAAELGTWDLDPQTNLFIYNQQLKHWFGLDPENEIDAPSALNAIVEKDRQKTIDAMAAAMAMGSDGNYEIQHTVFSKFDGKERVLLAKGKALFDENGVVYRFSGTGQDITEQVMARKELIEREEQLRFALEGGNLGYFDSYPQTGELNWSAKVKEFFGLSLDAEVNIEVYKNLVHPDDFKSVSKIMIEALQDKKVDLYENEFRTAHENQKWFKVTGKIKRDENGLPVRTTGVIQDITEKKIADKLLLESEYRFRDMIYTSPSLIAILRGENFIIDTANDAIIETWGKGKDVIGKPILKVLPEIAEQGFEEILNNVYETGIPFRAYEMPVQLTKEGVSATQYFTFVYQAQRDINGKIESVAILATDVTQQAELNKKVQDNERLLRETKEQLELTFANVPASIFLYGENKQILFVNEKAANMLGYDTVKELLFYKDFDTLMQKAGRDFFVMNEKNEPFTKENLPTSNALKSGKLGEMVFSMQKKSGGPKTWYLNKSAPILDAEGKVLMVLTTSTDITIQKLAEETIRDSESRFRLLSDNAPMWVWITDLEINVLYANLEILSYIGLSHYSEFTGKVWQQVVHPEDISIVMESFQKSVSEQASFDFEVRVKNVQKDLYEWFYLKGIPRYENEEFIGFIGTGMNVQQQKTFAQTLESEVQERTAQLKIANDMLYLRNDMLSVSESFNRNLTELSPNVVYIYDLEENKSIFLNQTGLKLIGKTWEKVEEMGDKYQSLIIHPDDMNSVLETIEKVKKSKNEEVFEHEYRVKNADGNWTPILARDTAFKRNKKKDVIQLLGIAIDITEIHKAKTVLEQKNLELEKMNKELESFAYVSSHDLQEPLRKIQAFSSRLIEKENDNLSETGKDYLRRMRMAGERMQQLIQDLLAYSRTKNSDRKFEKTDLETIISEVIDDLTDDLTLKNGSIIIGEVCDLNIIPFQFRQLIYNLISNSLKFARKDVPPVINVNCKIDKGKFLSNDKLLPEIEYCHISIVDNGIGFDANYKDKIFEIFQRLHGREEYMGTGIGLAIVKKIVENHNGFITATGEPNQGATFDIYIPA
jgi:PAS domain S-box-containing protein